MRANSWLGLLVPKLPPLVPPLPLPLLLLLLLPLPLLLLLLLPLLLPLLLLRTPPVEANAPAATVLQNATASA